MNSDKSALENDYEKTLQIIEQDEEELGKKIKSIQSKLGQYSQILENVDQNMNFVEANFPSFDTSGKQVFTTEQILENYNQSYFPLNYLELPLCRSGIQKKSQFWIAASVLPAVCWEKMQSLNQNRTYSHKKSLQKYFGFVCFGIFISFLESVTMDERCHINSSHYKVGQERTHYIKFLKNKIINQTK